MTPAARVGRGARGLLYRDDFRQGVWPGVGSFVFTPMQAKVVEQLRMRSIY